MTDTVPLVKKEVGIQPSQGGRRGIPLLCVPASNSSTDLRRLLALADKSPPGALSNLLNLSRNNPNLLGTYSALDLDRVSPQLGRLWARVLHSLCFSDLKQKVSGFYGTSFYDEGTARTGHGWTLDLHSLAARRCPAPWLAEGGMGAGRRSADR